MAELVVAGTLAARPVVDLDWICIPVQPGRLVLASVRWSLH